ncbi:hypothetical protein FSP39_004141 [Pinctada imbricata]|uniref:Uncharacterized protein n=1 Tax=Pinctada imbricata TaxID=66713 RepID=A0AA88YMB3_PINIB|nr:hypothetical protein FSP39_004141 [Pinctada imbricata]
MQFSITGPTHWHKLFKNACSGREQSPINIQREYTLYDPKLNDFAIWYDPPKPGSKFYLLNNGHTVQVNTFGPFYVANGGLPSVYTTAQFHFHWGDASHRGSEHTVDGKASPIELHVVSYDAETYPKISTAMKEHQGLAVLGVLFDVVEEDNPALEKLIRNFNAIRDPEVKTEVEMDAMPIRDFLPKDTSKYYRYNGSLTTPGCYESVVWTVFEDKQTISERQNIAMEMRIQNQMLNVWRRHRYGDRIRQVQEVIPIRDIEPGQPRHDRVSVDGDIISYQTNRHNLVGVYIAGDPLTAENYYFEVEILDIGTFGTIGVGLVPQQYPTDSQPGWRAFSVGFHADDGKLYKSNGFGKAFGPKSQAGDRIGCGVKFPRASEDDEALPAQMAKVFFTHNGKEVGTVLTPMPRSGLFPAVGMHSEGEEVKLNLEAEWHYEDLVLMAIDDGEEDWSRLHDVRLNGMILEYSGRGKSIHDVGLAQARFPLDTTNHYFEIEIVDPGENCYIAIGIARRNYPKHRHPGWNRGSIAYHADDGKIFVGSGVGDPFGPKCHKGDTMGCGILFPPDYDSEADSDPSPDDPDVNNMVNEMHGLYGSDSEDSDDDLDLLYPLDKEEQGTKVQVFFTRNGKIVGLKHICIPKGGFYPTVGMLSSCEKVRVDLHPLTG